MASIKDFPNLVFEGHSTDYQTKIKLRELVEEKENAEKMLEEKMDRWEYLEELAAKIAGQQS